MLCHVINDGYIGRGFPAPTNTATYHFRVDRLLEPIDLTRCPSTNSLALPTQHHAQVHVLGVAPMPLAESSQTGGGVYRRTSFDG